jgi:hypothetical protein
MSHREHLHTDQCGFDRNASHNAGHYVCGCGWEGLEPSCNSSQQESQKLNPTASGRLSGASSGIDTRCNSWPLVSDASID